MRKLFSRFILARYEKFNTLSTDEGRKQFIRTVYTLSIGAFAIVLIWVWGFDNLYIKRVTPNDLISPTEFSGNKMPPVVAEVNPTDDNKQVGDTKQKATKQEDTKQEATKQEATKQKDINQKDINQEKDTKNIVDTDKQKSEKEKVLVKKTINKGPNVPQVALTFDDGYNQKTVEKVLDVLKQKNVKSTFFIIGKVLDDYPEVWKRAIDEGHQICNHTNNHEILTKSSDDRVQAEILGWEASAKKVLGEDYVTRMKKEFPYLRLPGGGGAKSERILAIAQKNGYTVIGWNLETYSSIINPNKKTNSVQQISDKIEKHVVNKCSNGSIILLHFNQYDIGNIEDIVQGIINRGFSMKTVSEILE